MVYQANKYTIASFVNKYKAAKKSYTEAKNNNICKELGDMILTSSIISVLYVMEDTHMDT